MRNLQGIGFIWTQTYREIFKSALVYLQDLTVNLTKGRLCQLLASLPPTISDLPLYTSKTYTLNGRETRKAYSGK